MTRYTLTAADLFVIMTTLSESMAVSGHFTAMKEAREIVMNKVEHVLHGMEATFTVDDNEEDQ